MSTSSPIDIGSRRQLFFDESLFAATSGVRIVMNTPEDAGEAIRADRPWEAGLSCQWCVVVPDEKLGHVKMYYEATCPNPASDSFYDFRRMMCCAISSDGINWEKPDLGLYEFEGSRNNNIAFQGEQQDAEVGGDGVATMLRKDRAYDQMGSIVIDENDDPERRYKLIFAGAECKMRGATSPDGFRWTIVNDWKPISNQGADSGNIFFWDDAIGKWVGYFRMWDATRRIGRIISDDWTNWPDRTIDDLVLAPDELDSYETHLDHPCFRPGQFIDERIDGRRYDPHGPKERFVWCTDRVEDLDGMDFYNQPVTKYADGAYVMPFTVFHHRSNLEEIHLAVSRDGIRWERPGDRQPWIRMPVDEFCGMMYCAPGIIREGPHILHHHTRVPAWHGWGEPGRYEVVPHDPYCGSIRRARLRTDGYTSVDAGNAVGGFVTPPMVFDGRKLVLNADTGGGGWIRVELVREHGHEIWGYRINGFALNECDPVVTNATNHTVTWKGRSDVSELAGQPVRMHVRMRGAKLYAFQFAE